MPRPRERRPGIGGLAVVHSRDFPRDKNFAGGADTRALGGGVAAGTFTSVGSGAADDCTWTGTTRQHTTRNAPSSIGAVFYRELFWDGRATDAAAQAPVPITSAVEMSCAGRTFDELAAKLLDRTPLALQSIAPTDSVLGNLPATYRELVTAAFGSSFDADARFAEAWGQAIQAYESTLIPDQTPMDEFLSGQTSALRAKKTSSSTSSPTRSPIAARRKSGRRSIIRRSTCRTDPRWPRSAPRAPARAISATPVSKRCRRGEHLGEPPGVQVNARCFP